MDKKKIGAGFAGALQKAADATKAAKLAVQDMAADAKQSREKKKADAQKVLGTFASNTFDAEVHDTNYLGEIAQHRVRVGPLDLKAFEMHPKVMARDRVEKVKMWFGAEDVVVLVR